MVREDKEDTTMILDPDETEDSSWPIIIERLLGSPGLRRKWDDAQFGPRMTETTVKQHINLREMQVDTPINNIQSNFPHDLTGHVTKSSGFPFASGGYGDIYRGNLNMAGESIDVRCRFFSSAETKQLLDRNQDIQVAPAARRTTSHEDEGIY